MDSLKELFKIGNGPSSSHTMGPERAAKKFKAKNPEAKRFEVELYGSLALTGKGTSYRLDNCRDNETYTNRDSMETRGGT